MVRTAVEDRDLSQDSEIWLQGGGVEATDGRAAREPIGSPLHSELANLLDDDDQPYGTRRAAGNRVHYAGTPPA